MERVSVLCLSLLLCSLSGAELQDKEIIEQDKPLSVNVPEPQLYPSDIYAVLQEMSIKLAVLQTEMKQVQTLNQEQAAKLKEVDTYHQVGRVAFSASLLASGSGNTGPFNTHITLVFRHVVSNIGNAYNPHTGFFTAPVRGAYHFEFYIKGLGGSPGSAVGLVKNGEHIFMVNEQQTSGVGTSANGATLLLEAGDVVFLRLWASYVVFDNQNHHTTFSGHLLFPM